MADPIFPVCVPLFACISNILLWIQRRRRQPLALLSPSSSRSSPFSREKRQESSR